MTPIPFQTFKGYLRQMKFEDLNETGLFAMTKGFTGFADIPKPTEQETHEFIERAKERGITYNHIMYANKNSRRFAGDHTLPKSRYFSVCKNSDGYDDGTLQSELYAYYRPKDTGHLTIADLTNDKQRKSIIESGFPDTKGVYDIQILFLRENGKRSIIDIIPGIDNSASSLLIGIPVRVGYYQIDNVIDLRNPATAEWFAKSMSVIEIEVDNKKHSLNSLRGRLQSFAEILPTLMTQEIGGHIANNPMFSSQVGIWMRLNNVGALIYPSARNNSYVKIRNGKVEDFGGWNLVDYRNAPEPFFKLSIDLTIGWAKQFGYVESQDPTIFPQIKFDFEHHGICAGSWKVDGMVGLRQAIIRSELKKAGYTLPW